MDHWPNSYATTTWQLVLVLQIYNPGVLPGAWKLSLDPLVVMPLMGQ